MAQNWTTDIKVFLQPEAQLAPRYEAQLNELGVPVHRGSVTEVVHAGGKVEAVTLNGGERVAVGTLLWVPREQPSPLVQNLVENLGLQLNESGHIGADEMQRTNVARLWAAGDVQGWTGAIESAHAGGMAAFFIAHQWYGEPLT